MCEVFDAYIYELYEITQEEIEIIYLDVVIKELTRYSFSLKNELETLKILGNNIRLEMKL